MTAETIRRASHVHTAALGASILGLCGATAPVLAQGLSNEWNAAVASVEPKVIAWRRDFHQHPELSNREMRTAEIIAKHLRALGLEVRTGLAHTGVAGLLRGVTPGRTIALRADMDALPVTEQTDVPFKSYARAQFRGETVGVMHACGHDAHTAMLMGVAEILARRRNELAGQILFIFQPAEEGAPDGERGGAELMLEDGLFAIAQPDAVFGLHVMASLPSGVIGYRSGPMMAGADTYRLVVQGRQTHGSRPWSGVDPVLAAAQIVTGMQAIVSRQVDLTHTPVVLSVGAIKGGIRANIIPDSVEMVGTLRTFDPAVRKDVIARMQQTATHIAAASGATAELSFREDAVPPVINDPALTARAVGALRTLLGDTAVREISLQTPAEDFAFYGQRAPAFFFWMGVTPAGQDPEAAPFNHSPLFYIDESALATGMRALLHLTLESLHN
jgi:amidohydrolase